MTANDYCIIQTESLQQLADLLKGVEDGIKYLLARVSGEGKDDIVEFEFMKGVTSISGGSFKGFRNLSIINLPERLTSIGSEAFANCKSLTLTSLPEGLTSIGSEAFANCKSLTLTSLPEGLTSIASSAFAYCTSLALTSLPEGLTSIGNGAFAGCTSITEISLPSTLNSIERWAFGWNKLTSVSFKGTPKSINAETFNNCNLLTNIYVPWSEGAITGAPWGATKATINYNYTIEGD